MIGFLFRHLARFLFLRIDGIMAPIRVTELLEEDDAADDEDVEANTVSNNGNSEGDDHTAQNT